ncbi:orotidine 5'-phosphate decarboxylase [Pullulanibacillus sp. KACC 23026]|uniref:3-hexulose-6-phosphate synthase n=1 Tax=Pullulanibacillus sp. KACC 23026 TaxID=3028315 RepID=UPI0023AF693D|nr:3-hexulose-6-phosphate synthase [Pullulanibacillus sp. KACC 23026]WEG10789.1 orotidine 5'-phosphate decarboxylase [Pullulanibacillus sp. KACC 23026]
MKIQLALDRLTIDEAIRIGEEVKDYVDWIEVGTSLIKEFGVESIQKIKSVFPDKTIVADIKTIDNAKYEMELYFRAGADLATVMGVAPLVTIETSLETAAKWQKEIMIDLLNTSKDIQKRLLAYDAIFCSHVSKDEQEEQGRLANNNEKTSYLFQQNKKIAVAGGITLESLKNMKELNPFVVIVGSAITKANNRPAAAQAFQKLIFGGEIE